MAYDKVKEEMEDYLAHIGWRYNKLLHKWEKKGLSNIKIVMLDGMAIITREEIINADTPKQLQAAITELTNKSK